MTQTPRPEPDPDEPRTRRIVEVAVQLAEHGGFAAVRLRDVAEQAGVAMRTLYKRFAGKDELLFAVLVHQMDQLEELMTQRPVTGPTPVKRLRRLFEQLTGFICDRPNLGRAIIRALAGGSATLPQQVGSFHERVNALIIGALTGEARTIPSDPAHPHLRLGAMLQHVWFSSLVGWLNGIHSPEKIVESVLDAASLVLEPPGERGE